MTLRKLGTAATLLVLPLATAASPALAAKGKAHHPHGKTHHVGKVKPKVKVPHKGHKPVKPGKPKAGTAVRSVTFDAKVVRSSPSELVLKKADGSIVSFSRGQIADRPQVRATRQARAARWSRAFDMSLTAGSVIVNIQGLEPGTTVTITETISPDGTVTIAIKLPKAQPAEPLKASGVISDLGDDALTVTGSDGTAYRMHMSKDALAALNLQACQIVDATYKQMDGLLIALTLTPNGSSTTGDCAQSTDTKGVVSAISADSITITSDAGSVSYALDPSQDLGSGYSVGDLVDVTSVDAADGTHQATSIQFVEEQVGGTVSSVTTATNGGTLTVSPSDSTPDMSFGASAGGVQLNTHAFNGISVGDSVTLDYHQAAGHLVADTVSEQ